MGGGDGVGIALEPVGVVVVVAALCSCCRDGNSRLAPGYHIGFGHFCMFGHGSAFALRLGWTLALINGKIPNQLTHTVTLISTQLDCNTSGTTKQRTRITNN